ncbi:hypothetical protein B0H19DRAFT_517226 [Mycena capillaripes]|nr:hypothetical protein B0H19DRAFT_517226 [Mycena capillaripes]
MVSFKFTSLLAAAFAVTGAAAARVTTTALEMKVGNFPSPALTCLAPGLSIPRINLVKSVLASGQYVLVPHLPLANCGSEVFYVNNNSSSSDTFFAWAIGVAPDDTLRLGPAAFAESCNNTSSFNVTYTLSPANGRRRL